MIQTANKKKNGENLMTFFFGLDYIRVKTTVQVFNHVKVFAHRILVVRSIHFSRNKFSATLEKFIWGSGILCTLLRSTSVGT